MRERFEVVWGVGVGVWVSCVGRLRNRFSSPYFDEEVEILPVPLLFLFYPSSIPRLAITR